MQTVVEGRGCIQDGAGWSGGFRDWGCESWCVKEWSYSWACLVGVFGRWWDGYNAGLLEEADRLVWLLVLHARAVQALASCP